ncbi:AsmA family protein [Candidatus Thiomargarita nelsonii]|uniref:AsmA family protein n=1 Tax=Candidatus Thiomargarita nelsonii TaxID=1003181 RepID=A0A0A6P115_9GAMM|nr:AsmA family protein [Candidatus Thiomargarita nelsonii]
MKLLLSLLGGIIALLLIAILIIVFVIDPNDYKPQIANLVENATGRTLTIEGDINLTFYPWLGLQLGKVSLGNAPGFDAPEFAKIDQARVQVKLLPLFKKHLEIGTVLLEAATINLTRKSDGHTNWEDLAAQGGDSEDKPKESTSLKGFKIDGLDLRHAKIVWDDQQANSRYVLSDLNFKTSALVLNEPVKIQFNTALDIATLTGQIDLNTQLILNLENQQYRLDPLQITVTVQGDNIPEGKQTLSFNTQVIDIDLNKETLDAETFTLEAFGVKLNGQVDIKQMLSQPTLQGSLKVAAFNPRQLLQRLGQAVPTDDPKALDSLSLEMQLQGALSQLRLANLKIQLDNSHLEGNIGLEQDSTIAFNLNLDQIDIDRYLPPSEEAKEPASPPPSSEEELLPLEMLRALNLNGILKVAQLKAANLKLNDLQLEVSAKQGKIKVTPKATLYQGNYQGNLTLDAQTNSPRIHIDQILSNVQASPLLKDLVDHDQITGTANLTSQLTSEVTTSEQLLNSLTGTLNFSFSDGVLKGLNIEHSIRQARALLKGETLPDDKTAQTDFKNLRGTFQFKNGSIYNDDLSLTSSRLRVKGSGQIVMSSQELNFDLKTVIVDTGDHKNLEALKGAVIPLKVTGYLKSPKLGVDSAALEAALLEQAKASAATKLEEEKQKLIEKHKDKIPEPVNDLLKDFKLF